MLRLTPHVVCCPRCGHECDFGNAWIVRMRGWQCAECDERARIENGEPDEEDDDGDRDDR